MKKGLSIILTLAMLMLTLPVSAVASELQEAEITNGAEPPEQNVVREYDRSDSTEADPLDTDEAMLQYEYEQAIKEASEEYALKYEQMMDELRKVDHFIVKPLSSASAMTTLGGIDILTRKPLRTGASHPDEYIAITLAEKVYPEEFMAQVGGSVEFIQPDHELEISNVPLEQETSSELKKISTPALAWDTALGDVHQVSTGAGVTVALLDTGVDLTHPDLVGHFVDSWNFLNGSADVSASGTSLGEAHGTHIAGIISNVAPDAKIMPLQVFEYGKAYTSDVVAAIQYAEAHGADIVNCSWGNGNDNPILRETIEASGMLFVAAVGNNSRSLDETPIYPASYDLDNVISVAAVDSEGELGYFSNYGAAVDIGAWGVEIVSTIPGGGYGEMTGTSVSAGFASGIVALALSNNAGTTVQQEEVERLSSFLALAGGSVSRAAMMTTAAEELEPISESDAAESWEHFNDSKTVQIAVGNTFTLALKEDGTVWAWGYNNFGQCGSKWNENGPAPIPGLTGIKEVAAGWTHGAALREDGTVWTWGSNTSGQLGNGTNVSTSIPVQVTGLPKIETLSCVFWTDGTLAIENETSAWRWGGKGALVPQKVTFSEPMKKVILHQQDGGSSYLFGLNTAGNIRRLELNGELMQEIKEVTDIVDIAGNGYSCFALKADGTVWGYGRNVLGALGDGTNNERYYFARMKSEDGNGYLTGIKAIGTGVDGSFAISEDGTLLYCGTVNDGTGYPIKSGALYCPKKVVGPDNTGFLEKVVMAGAGNDFTAALVEDGSVYTWGRNNSNGMGLPHPLSYSNVPIKVGVYPDIKIGYLETVFVSRIPYFQDINTLSCPATCSVPLEDGKTMIDIPVTWFLEEALRSASHLTIPGKYTELPDGIINPMEYSPSCKFSLIPEEVISIEAPGRIIVAQGTPAEELGLPQTVTANLPYRGYEDVAVSWNTSGYDPNNITDIQTLQGNVRLPMGYECPWDMRPKIEVEVKAAVTVESVAAIDDIELKKDTTAAQLISLLPKTVEVVLSDQSTAQLAVDWDVTGYDPELLETPQTLTGTLVVRDNLTNPQGLTAQIEVIVREKESEEPITHILPQTMSAAQNIHLAPTEKENPFGDPTTESLPATAVAELSNGTTVELPVVWDTAGYDPAVSGLQTLTGEVVIAEDLNIANPNNKKAALNITVLPKTYELWDADPLEVSIEAAPGSEIADLNRQLLAEGKAEIAVQAVDLETDFEVFTFCNVTLTAEDNPDYQNDVPGEYTLTARLPDNFTPLADDIPGPIQVKVTIPELTVTGIETAHMDAYQSVAPEHLTDIPAQVNVTLEGGKVIPVNVTWDWSSYAPAKDTAGEHIILGELTSLPAYAKLPEGEDLKPALVVNTIPVDYVVTGVLSDNLFEGDAGLTLEELTAILSPALTLQITSTTIEPAFTTEYVVSVVLEQEKNGDFDLECDGVYILTGTLALPENITCPPNKFYDEIILQTYPVEILSLEPAYALADEGTPFAQLEGLPTQVMATLSSVGSDGEHKRVAIGADWGTGTGYDPLPEGLTDDNSVTMEVTGTLSDCPQYINGAGAEPTLIITMTRVFDLVGVSPSRIPETGELEVKLGSTLEDIYALLASHSAELTLQNPRGETSTATVTFTLREEDNSDYDPMTTGTYTLAGYLPLSAKVRNPDNLGVEIVVKPTKYTISSVKVTRVTGVVSGTPFDEINIPSTVTVLRNDKQEDQVPATWNGSSYNPTKIGSQKITGTLVTPLPVHLENPNNRQPSGVITIVDPTARILSLEQLPADSGAMLSALEETPQEDDPALTEYRYLAEILYKDGTVTTEVISVFVENEL